MLHPYLMIGEVLRPQGVHGEAKIRPYAQNLEDFLNWKTLYLKEGETYTPIAAKCSRVHDGFAYLTLGDCKNPEDVEKLRGRELWIDRAHAAELAEGEVYISDLIGCVLVDEQGQRLGTLRDVLQHGPTDIYVFDTPRGEMMAPALLRAFPVTDMETQTITADTERLQEIAVYAD